jgi:hypothetical protein
MSYRLASRSYRSNHHPVASCLFVFSVNYFGCFRYPSVDCPFRPPCHRRRHHYYRHWLCWDCSIWMPFHHHHHQFHLDFHLQEVVPLDEGLLPVVAVHSDDNRHDAVEEDHGGHTTDEAVVVPQEELQKLQLLLELQAVALEHCNSHKEGIQEEEGAYVEAAVMILVQRRSCSLPLLDCIDLQHRVVLVAVVSALSPCSASSGLAARPHQSASVDTRKTITNQ